MLDVRDYIIENGILFKILLNENEHNFIFKDENLEEENGTIGNNNLKVFDVLSTRYIDGELYGYLKGRNELGWTKLKNSKYIYSKKETFVFIKDNESIQNKPNQDFNMIKWFKNEVKEKFLTSKGLIKFDDQYYEVVFNKNTLIGFIHPTDLDVGYKIDIPVQINSNGDYYLESSLSNKVENIEDTLSYNAKLFFPKKGLVRVLSDKSNYWTEIRNLKEESQRELYSSIEKYNPLDNIEINDVINNFLSERKKSKSLLISLIKEKINVNTFDSKPTKGDHNLNHRYQNLKNSKLGRLQIKYWKFRKKWRKNRG